MMYHDIPIMIKFIGHFIAFLLLCAEVIIKIAGLLHDH